MPCILKTKLRSLVTSSNPPRTANLTDLQHNCDEEMWQIIIDPLHEKYGSRSCRERELWHARQAFLTSYHFSAHQGNGLKRRLSRSVKETGAVVVEAGSRFGQRIRGGWAGLRAARAGLFHHAGFLVVRCFMPWGEKLE